MENLTNTSSQPALPTAPKRKRTVWVGCLITAIIFLCAIPLVLSKLLDAQLASFVAREYSHIRVYERAIRDYKNDHKTYPTWRTIAPPLTTPVTYLHAMIDDSFSKALRGSPEAWIHHVTNGTDYLIWSVGPDGRAQITGLTDLESGKENLILKHYDATNGAASSSGDLIRTSLY